MAIQTGIFKTPTGPVYNPAQQIERGFDKTTGIITDYLGRKAQDYDQQQAMFSELYSNLGELESKLQENYAGMNQQMIDSTREWLKQNLKSGVRANDPEFQMGLGQRIGRIRAAMSNADRNRELLKQAGEMIKADTSIVDKASAMASLFNRMNDPDFLISKNQFQVDEFLDQYVNPTIVSQEVASMLKNTGTISDKRIDESGKMIEESINLNEAIDAENPLIKNPDGTTRLNIKPSDQLVTDLVGGKFGARAGRIINQIATQSYGGVTPESLKKATVDFLSRGMGPSIARRTLMTKEELESKKIRDEKELANIRLINAKMQKELDLANKTEKQQKEINDRWNEFVSAYDGGQKGFLGDYENINPNVIGFKWISEREQNKDVVDAVSSKQKWDSLDRDTRVSIIEKLGVSGEVPSALGGIGKWETKSDQAYNAVKSVVDQFSTVPSGIQYQQKTGTSQGKAVYQPVIIPIQPGNEDDLIKAFKSLENLRITGKNYKPVAPTEGKATPTGQATAADYMDVFVKK